MVCRIFFLFFRVNLLNLFQIGAFDPVSYEWTDGIASRIFRIFAVDPSLTRKWVKNSFLIGQFL